MSTKRNADHSPAEEPPSNKRIALEAPVAVPEVNPTEPQLTEPQGQPIDTEKQGGTGTPSSTGPIQADNSPGAPSSQIALATVPNTIEQQPMAVLMQGQQIDTEKQSGTGTPSSTGPVKADNSPGAPSSQIALATMTNVNPIEQQPMAVLMQTIEQIKENQEKIKEDVAKIREQTMTQTRYSIPLVIDNCEERFKSENELEINSQLIEVFGSKWFLQATKDKDEHAGDGLSLHLHMKKPNTFIGHYCVEVDCDLSIENNLGNTEVAHKVVEIFSGNIIHKNEADDLDNIHSTGEKRMMDYKTLLDTDDDFIHDDGSIKCWADFTIKSSTLNYLMG